MAAGSAPLAELLQALAPPLEYLATDDFRRLDQTRLPLRALAERLERARVSAPADIVPTLDALDGILRGLAGDAAGHADLVRQAHALLPALRAATETSTASVPSPPPSPTTPWTDYRPSTGNVDIALARLGESVSSIRSVGPKRATELQRFGLRTIEDVLYHLPFRYEDWRVRVPIGALRAGDDATAVGTVAGVRQALAGKQGRRVLEVILRDDGASLLLVWFNQVPYFANRFVAG
ncbi:MAG TPA: hypothetical protein VGR62_22335, partial [Candidatus Binatia bacterium]|nr:hypothetical protein [Candidatus Binatia bacterium]